MHTQIRANGRLAALLSVSVSLGAATPGPSFGPAWWTCAEGALYTGRAGQVIAEDPMAPSALRDPRATWGVAWRGSVATERVAVQGALASEERPYAIARWLAEEAPDRDPVKDESQFMTRYPFRCRTSG